MSLFYSLYTKTLRINTCQIEKMRAYRSHWPCGEPEHLVHGRNPRSLIISGYGSFSLRSALVKSRGRSPTRRDIITGYLVHYSKHSWDEVLQGFCLLGDNSFATCFNKGKIRTRSQRLEGTFFQELDRQTLSVCQQREHTSNIGNTDDNLRN